MHLCESLNSIQVIKVREHNDSILIIKGLFKSIQVIENIDHIIFGDFGDFRCEMRLQKEQNTNKLKSVIMHLC
jgi:hypothetical protein